MSMIKCKECKKEISDKADSCPHCGAKAKKKTGCLTIIVGIFFLLVAITMVTTIISNSNKPQQQSKIIKPKYTTIEEDKMIDKWFDTILKSSKDLNKISLSSDRKELTITISDIWYNSPKYQKERILQLMGKQFALFATQMGWRGDNPEASNYPTVKLEDLSGKMVGKQSTWGTKIYE